LVKEKKTLGPPTFLQVKEQRDLFKRSEGIVIHDLGAAK
jgi:hypothetical protein